MTLLLTLLTAAAVHAAPRTVVYFEGESLVRLTLAEGLPTPALRALDGRTAPSLLKTVETACGREGASDPVVAAAAPAPAAPGRVTVLSLPHRGVIPREKLDLKEGEEITLFTLSPLGPVELEGPRLVRVPAGPRLPLRVVGDFASLVTEIFAEQRRQHPDAARLLFSGTLEGCVTCPGEPLRPEDRTALGGNVPRAAGPFGPVSRPWHARRYELVYRSDRFPEGLRFRRASPGRAHHVHYRVLVSAANCPSGAERRRAEETALAILTGRSPERGTMGQ